ncbi:MAG: SPOR domain-containing protein [Sphingomonas sp.]|nr:SPOR domain-containing protein [Sphingomonas sp.]
MSDRRTGYDDGQLPWLQAVDDEDEPRGLSARKMFIALLVVIAAALIVAATFFWLGRREAVGDGPPELIKAPAGPYKIKPTDPGGLDVAGDSETAFETSAGQDPDAQLDLSKVPETPVQAPPKPLPTAPVDPKAAIPPVAAPGPAAPARGGSGSVVQLGAFQNQAQAERAWTALSSRFPSVAAMTKMVVLFSGGIRLRASAASPADAKAACQALKAAGESCFVAQ